jgi:starch-binding outer membrane protein, SusD/RagB family
MRAWGLAFAFATVVGAVAACSQADSLLEVEDPDVINPQNLNSASAARALAAGVALRLSQATSGDESLFLFGGLLADEWRSGDTFEQRNTTDQRSIVVTNSFLAGQLRTLMRIRIEGNLAIAGLRQYQPTPKSAVGRIFGFRAFAENMIGEHYCNGIPFSSLNGGTIVYGEPVSIDSAFRMAVNSADSARTNVAAAEADSADVVNFASVVKARALLNLNDYAAAAAAVATVPTAYKFNITHSSNANSNQIWSLNTSARRYVQSDTEGVNGLPFRTANDPRVKTSRPTATPTGFDTFTPFIANNNWTRFAAVTIVSGIEARLIEAEAALKAGSPTWLTILNNLRANGGVAGLAPLVDPVTPTARVDLLFRERAFWLFGTGHRLGDLRRLIRQYNRNSETVFPTGAFHKGGNYGTDVNIPVPFDEENNPNFTGCTNRDA